MRKRKITNEKKESFFLKKLIAGVALMMLLLFICAVALVFSTPFLIKKIFHRSIEFSSISFNPLNNTFTILNPQYSIVEGDLLFEASQINVSIDWAKTFGLRPTLSSLYVNKPSTFVIQEGAAYSFPSYIPTISKKEGRSKAFPFTVNELIIENGELLLSKSGKKQRFISAVSVVLPSVSTELGALEPIISGRIGGKFFSFQGKSDFSNQQMRHDFDLVIDDFDIAKDAGVLPLIPGILINKGKISVKMRLHYAVDRRKRTSFVVSGALKAKDLYVSTAKGAPLLRNFSGVTKINSYVVNKGLLDVESLHINAGEFYIPKKETSGSSIKTRVGRLSFDDLIVQMEDFGSVKLNGEVKYYGDDTRGMQFLVNGSVGKAGKFSFKGEWFDDKWMIESGVAENFDLLAFPTISLPKWLHNVTVERVLLHTKKGAPEILVVDMVCRDVNAEFGDFYSSLSRVTGVFEYNQKSRELLLHELAVNYGSLSQKDVLLVDNLNVALSGAEAISFVLNEPISFEGVLPFVFLNCSFPHANPPFSVNVNRPVVDLSLGMSKGRLVGRFGASFDSAKIFNEVADSVVLRKVAVVADSLHFSPLRMFVSSVEAEYVFLRMDIHTNGELIVGGSVRPDKLGFGNAESFIHVSKFSIHKGDVLLSDVHMKLPLVYEFSDFSFFMTNFPSYVYPQGKIEFQGKVDKSNPFALKAEVGNNGLKGDFKADNLLLFRLSPYVERYAGHKLLGGRLDTKVNFESRESKTFLDIDLNIRNPVVEKEDKNVLLNLKDSFEYLKDKNGAVNIKLPVSLSKDKADVDFFAVFFDVFRSNFANTANKIVNPFSESIRFDTKFYTAYFSPGSVLPKDFSVLEGASDSIKNNEKVFFVISSFVDKLNDSEYLKRRIFNEMKAKKIANSEEELLRLLYREVLHEDSGSLDMVELSKRILANIVVPEEFYFALANERSMAIRDILLKNYNISAARVRIEDDAIFDNPFVSGSINSMSIIRTGR